METMASPPFIACMGDDVISGEMDRQVVGHPSFIFLLLSWLNFVQLGFKILCCSLDFYVCNWVFMLTVFSWI